MNIIKNVIVFHQWFLLLFSDMYNLFMIHWLTSSVIQRSYYRTVFQEHIEEYAYHISSQD